jgi:hypothetical protein
MSYGVLEYPFSADPLAVAEMETRQPEHVVCLFHIFSGRQDSRHGHFLKGGHQLKESKSIDQVRRMMPTIRTKYY